MTNTHNNLWEQYQRVAQVAHAQGNFTKAARVIKEALREAEDYGEVHSGLVTIAHVLAEGYLRQNRFAEAENLYRAVLEVREKVLGQTHDEVIDSLKKVGAVQILSFRSEALGRDSLQVPLPWVSDAIAAAS